MRPTTIGLSFAALIALSATGLLLFDTIGGESHRVWQAWHSIGLELPDPALPGILAILNFPLWGALMIAAVLFGGCVGLIRYANDH